MIEPNIVDESCGYVLADHTDHEHLMAEIMVGGLVPLTLTYENPNDGLLLITPAPGAEKPIHVTYERLIYVLESAAAELKRIYQWKLDNP